MLKKTKLITISKRMNPPPHITIKEWDKSNRLKYFGALITSNLNLDGNKITSRIASPICSLLRMFCIAGNIPSIDSKDRN